MANYPWASNFLAYAFPCCDCGVCYLTLPTLLIDGDETPYADLSTAQAALTDLVAGCMVQQSPTNNDVVFSASMTGETLNISREEDATIDPELAGAAVLFACQATAAGGIAIDYAVNTNAAPSVLGISVAVYAESDLVTPVDSDSDGAPDVSTLSGTFNLTIPSDGVYLVFITYGVAPGDDPILSMDLTASCSSGAAWSICEARAAWDDSGTTAYEAC